MTNHPNRSGQNSSRNPSPDEIAALREQCQLTKAQAAELVHSSERTWDQWEGNTKRMHPAVWELFQRKTGTYPGQD